jgi:hypothetical protein
MRTTSSTISGPIKTGFTTKLKEAGRIWLSGEFVNEAVGDSSFLRKRTGAKSGGGSHKEGIGRGAKDIGKK